MKPAKVKVVDHKFCLNGKQLREHVTPVKRNFMDILGASDASLLSQSFIDEAIDCLSVPCLSVSVLLNASSDFNIRQNQR